MMTNYGAPSRTFISGKGCVLKDDQGKSYLDFLAGIATNVLGHGHPAVIKAVTKQVSTLAHVSNFFAHPQGLRLASRLQEMTCLLYTSPSPRDRQKSRMPSSA